MAGSVAQAWFMAQGCLVGGWKAWRGSGGPWGEVGYLVLRSEKVSNNASGGLKGRIPLNRRSRNG
jgi:hypothetical protein